MTRHVAIGFVLLTAALAGCNDTRGWSHRDAGPPPSDSGMNGGSCGDGTCVTPETCTTCPTDCGSCSALCGDGVCAATESCSSCPSDCGSCPASCGDGLCASTETCSTCPTDCGTCPARCGDGTCNSTESCSSCPSDCGSCSSCTSDPVPMYSGAPCSSATRTCTDGCTDGACIADCLDADPSPDCSVCANQNIISCANSDGCQADWDCYSSCFTDMGCTGGDACSACSSQSDAYNTCLAGTSCGTSWTSCLP